MSVTHTASDCERELKRQPGYSVHLGIPEVFTCSCGRVWRYVDSESDGAWWQRDENDESHITRGTE